MKTCRSCGVSKPRDAFSPKGGRDRNYCKACEAAKEAARYRAQQAKQDEQRITALRAGGSGLVSFGTAIEREIAEAVLAKGDIVLAAEDLGIAPSRVRAYLTELQRRAAARGFSPPHDMTRAVPEGYRVKGVSTLYNGDGEVRAQWVKTKRDEDDRLVDLLDAVSAIAADFRGAADPVRAPRVTDDDLLCVYPMGDPHLGAYAWARETGEDFDLAIAERNLVAAVDHLVDLAPRARRALVIDLGDFFHADNSTNQTLRSHHALDVDTRWSKVLSVGVRTLRRIVDRALTKHDEITVICEIGNHDDHSALMLALALQLYYEREPRVTVDTSPAPFHWYRFGANLIGVHHGHSVKARDLPGVMACDRAADWGETKHRYWYCGHVHHDSLKEYPGVTVETFRTLAARDAWHHGQGYRSGRDMKLDVLHREYGRINRHIVGIQQVVAREQTGETLR